VLEEEGGAATAARMILSLAVPLERTLLRPSSYTRAHKEAGRRGATEVGEDASAAREGRRGEETDVAGEETGASVSGTPWSLVAAGVRERVE
jgi:hypothetical protein